MKYLKVFSFLFIASLVLLGAAQPALACDGKCCIHGCQNDSTYTCSCGAEYCEACWSEYCVACCCDGCDKWCCPKCYHQCTNSDDYCCKYCWNNDAICCKCGCCCRTGTCPIPEFPSIAIPISIALVCGLFFMRRKD